MVPGTADVTPAYLRPREDDTPAADTSIMTTPYLRPREDDAPAPDTSTETPAICVRARRLPQGMRRTRRRPISVPARSRTDAEGSDPTPAYLRPPGDTSSTAGAEQTERESTDTESAETESADTGAEWQGSATAPETADEPAAPDEPAAAQDESSAPHLQPREEHTPPYLRGTDEERPPAYLRPTDEGASARRMPRWVPPAQADPAPAPGESTATPASEPLSDGETETTPAIERAAARGGGADGGDAPRRRCADRRRRGIDRLLAGDGPWAGVSRA